MLVTHVEPRPQTDGRTLYLVRANDGETYATYDGWTASLCLEAMKASLPMKIQSSGGWYYRNLTFAALEQAPA